jgi:hypothetical protein
MLNYVYKNILHEYLLMLINHIFSVNYVLCIKYSQLYVDIMHLGK